jgi:hypothetical protein
MSSKTTNPESTKPSAVMGVLRAVVGVLEGREAPTFGAACAGPLCADGWSGWKAHRTATMANPQANDLRDCADMAPLEFDLMASLNSLLYSTKGVRVPTAYDNGTILQLAFIARNPGDLQ